MSDTAPLVIHNAAQQRFECTINGHLNVADYLLSNGRMVMTHTEVHPSLQGRGVAAALVSAALSFAREEKLPVDPACAYVRAYLQRHPEAQPPTS